MILGAHESVAGGLHLAFERAARDRAEAVQLWCRSSRQWEARPLLPGDVRAFRAAHRLAGRPPLAAHASYLINLAAAKGPVRRRSIAALTDELARAEALGVGQVIVHPGASIDGDAERGVAWVVAGLQAVLATVPRRARVRLLLENTAGQGSCVGATLPELAAMLAGAADDRLGICLDTQHLWAAGLDWTTPGGYQALFDEVEALVGLERLGAFHLNDSRRPLGARVDRHERIGEGAIGLEPFRRLVTDPRFAALPGYLETPPRPDGEASYAEGLCRLRSLLPAARAAG